MTSLKRPVKRRVAALDGAPLIVTLDATGIVLRRPRERTAFLLPYATAYQWAAELKVAGGRIARPHRRVR